MRLDKAFGRQNVPMRLDKAFGRQNVPMRLDKAFGRQNVPMRLDKAFGRQNVPMRLVLGGGAGISRRGGAETLSIEMHKQLFKNVWDIAA